MCDNCSKEHADLKEGIELNRLSIDQISTQIEHHLLTEGELVEHAVEKAFDSHLDTRHHPSLQELTGQTPTEVVTEYLDSREVIHDNRTGIESIVNALEGPKRKHLDGTLGPEREAEHGALQKIDQMWDKIANGGGKMKTRLDWKDRAAILATIAFIVAKQIGLF